MSVTAKLLVIDDERPAVMVMKRLLSVQGYDVSFAFDGATGLEKAREERPDLIILSEVTSRMNGDEVLNHLRADETTANIPVLVLTARRRSAETETGTERSVGQIERPIDFLAKPVKTQELLRRVLALLKAAVHTP